MTAILEYIMQNYTWFLGGTIIILLAIVGGYADKTNFGQGKNTSTKGLKRKEQRDEVQEEIENHLQELSEKDKQINNTLSENTVVNDQVQQVALNEITYSPSIPNYQMNIENNDNQNMKESVNNEIIEPPKILEEKKRTTEEEIHKFNEEFNLIIPKKEVINEELLNDIDSLSLDKTQRFNFREIPDLDDVELPKIKSLIDDTDEDIWRH